MAVFAGNNCPFCGVYVKQENMKNHIKKVHPRFSEGIKKVTIDKIKCPICGKNNELNNTRSGLSICDDHYVNDTRAFLTRNFYLPLKEKNNTEIVSEPQLSAYLINLQLHVINSFLGWEPENISEGRYLFFNEACIYTGYLILRLIEIIPNIREIMYQISENGIHNVSKNQKSKMNRLNILINSEFELFIGIKLASYNLYDIAVDSKTNPKLIIIIPNISTESANNLLLMRLKDANEQWHGTFHKFVYPYGRSTARDEFGTTFSFNRDLIKENFSLFIEIWNDYFKTDSMMCVEDFEKIWDWLKWVITQDGITYNDQTNAKYFDDYENFGLKKEVVFQVLNDILQDPSEKMELISRKELSQFDPNMSVLFKLADLARGFKIETSRGYVYYLTCREWFYNKLIPVFIRFLRKLEYAGPLFEKDIEMVSEIYSHSGIKLGGKSSLGIMIEPRMEERSKSVTSRSTPWRILERNYEITLEKDDITEKIGEFGEIDLIVYANMNVWLLELKARNLDSNRVIKYYRDDAPIQCARYSSWVKSKGFNQFLEKHSLEEDKINSIRIVICSSGVFRDLLVNCKETSEKFAIVSEYTLFSTMAGIFSLSLKESFPDRIENIAPGIKIADNNVYEIVRLDLNYELGVKLSELLINWTEHIKIDRRISYEKNQIDVDYAKSVNVFGTTYISYEAYIGDTTSWILPEPHFIDSSMDYKYYIGTQVGNMGTTLVCATCKTSIKYYWPQKNSKEDVKKVQDILQKSTCPICGSMIDETEETDIIRNEMSKIMAKFKFETGEDFV